MRKFHCKDMKSICNRVIIFKSLIALKTYSLDILIDENYDSKSSMIIKSHDVLVLKFWIEIFDFCSENKQFFIDKCSLKLIYK